MPLRRVAPNDAASLAADEVVGNAPVMNTMPTPGARARCPWCGENGTMDVATGWLQRGTSRSETGADRWRLIVAQDHAELLLAHCPGCTKLVVVLKEIAGPQMTLTLRHPRHGRVRRAPDEVRAEHSQVAKDFDEAAAVLEVSPTASAALSRRCLQHVIRRKMGITKGKLYDEISEAAARLPGSLAENLDHIRVIGNYASHPEKSEQAQALADVEDGEAEWSLELLLDLFDHLYVAPARHAARKQALAKKKELVKKANKQGKGP